MNKLRTCLILFISLSILLSACLPITPIPGSSSEAMIQTAIAQTQMAEKGREAAASLYGTSTTDGTVESTDGETPEPNEGEAPEIQPTSPNPWMLQEWCEDHMTGCAKYDVYNKTDSWLQITLRNTETGATGFFTIQSKTMGQITLIPGQYQATFTWWCKGDIRSMTETMPIGLWKDYFKCPQGHYQRQKK